MPLGIVWLATAAASTRSPAVSSRTCRTPSSSAASVVASAPDARASLGIGFCRPLAAVGTARPLQCMTGIRVWETRESQTAPRAPATVSIFCVCRITNTAAPLIATPGKFTITLKWTSDPFSKPGTAGIDGNTQPLHHGVMLISERIGTNLKMIDDRLLPFSRLHVERSARAVGGPEPTSLPARFRIVDASIEVLGVETERVGDA